ncbi:hypothetical protein [Nocardia salmonicida]|uniref:hypothetical protein n=1 Tax=Nocardia salmonicida TaxID=53431 RepID=UPI002E299696|nr:hypothetical protein [Nocardia salmonicida]
MATSGLAAVTALAGIFAGGRVSRQSQDRHLMRDSQSAAYSTFLQEYGKVEIDLREAYAANRPNTADWESFNASLAALSLVAPTDVSAATLPIRAAIEALLILIAREPKVAAEYERVHSTLTQAQIAFVNAARRSLDGKLGQLDFVVGGTPRWGFVAHWLPSAYHRSDPPNPTHPDPTAE